ncbi:uncharacterized protein [Diadema antillarum]|uniref:uncharacterized protein n=1 Tax=Diadema antillarum TaxID=105358 RepID=UPI003A890E09
MMAADLPRGGFHGNQASNRRKGKMIRTVPTNETTTTSRADIPRLVRVGQRPARMSRHRISLGDTSVRQAAAGFPIVSPRLTMSMPDGDEEPDAETKRRAKLRDVIAMMELSQRPVKRPNDVRTRLHERAVAVEKEAKRRAKAKTSTKMPKTGIGDVTNNGDDNDDDDNDDDDAQEEAKTKENALRTMGKWQEFIGTRRALARGRRLGFAGHLPVKKAGANRKADKVQSKASVKKTLGRFPTVVKLIIYLLRLSKTYIFQESDARMVSLFSDIDAARASDHYKIRGDLLYDVTQFRAQKSQRISKESKKILQKPSGKRTAKDIHHVMVELQQMKNVTQYPIDKQRGLVSSCWYEEYPTGRVIIRYGRRPQAFYVILGGSALHLEGDPTIPGRPVTSLNKGDMFGEQAIANQGRHAYTIISKETIQLMCLSPEDYCRIFLAGGMDNFSSPGKDNFINSVCIFKHWPVQLLKNNHKQTKFQFFVHGKTIVEDSNDSEWIIIVKSGSCSVLKKLVDPRTIPEVTPAVKKKRISVPTTRYRKDFNPAESHQDMLQRKLRELQRRRTKSLRNNKWKQYIKKPTQLLKIDLHDDPFEESDVVVDYRGGNNPLAAEFYKRYEDSLKNTSRSEELPKDGGAVKAEPKEEDAMEVEGQDSEGGRGTQGVDGTDEIMDTSETAPGGAVKDAPNVDFAKGPFMTHKKKSRAHLFREPSNLIRELSKESAEHSQSASQKDTIAQQNSVSQEEQHSKLKSLTRKDSMVVRRENLRCKDRVAPRDGGEAERASVTQDSGMTDLTEAIEADIGANGMDDDDEEDEEEKKRIPIDPDYKFVMIDTIEKGGVFGVLDLAFGAQPSLSLVSNGAECIMVKKKFYKKHADDKAIWGITESLRPYPDEETLTKDLKEKLTWKDHRDATLKATAQRFKRMRKRLADPRIQRPAVILDTYT